MIVKLSRVFKICIPELGLIQVLAFDLDDFEKISQFVGF